MADFKVQRGQASLADTVTSVTITAGTDYTAPSAITKAFIRITSVAQFTDGKSVAFGGQADHQTVTIDNPGNLVTSITFTRSDGSDSINFQWEIIEYVGSAGGVNEFKVLGQEVLSLTGTATTADSSAWTPADDNDVVAFVTAQRNDDTSSGRGDGSPANFTSEWVAASNLIRITRSNTDRTGQASICAVEFTGTNWKVQRVTHSFSAQATDETETITTVSAITEVFTHIQHRSSEINTASQLGFRAWVNSTTQATFHTDNVGTSHDAVMWIMENSGLSVEQKSGTWSSSATDPDTLDVSVTTVSALSETALAGVGATIGNSSEGDLHQLMMGARMTSTSNVRLSRGISDRQRVYRFEVVQFPSAAVVAAVDSPRRRHMYHR